MKVLLACEESQEVCKRFREKGHEAYSCDIQDCSGGHPKWHIKGDVLEVINNGWDLMIAFPPCTYLTVAGMRWLKTDKTRYNKLLEARDFFLKLWAAPIEKIGIENPVGWMNTNWRKPTQIIEPYYFGDNEKKRTCLWLKGLSRLNGLIEVAMNPKKYKPKPYQTIINKKGRTINVYFANRLEDIGNSKARSKTFPGIAKAMAEQWG